MKKVFQIARPQKNDIAVFKCPDRESQDCVKRVIGQPGDRLEVRKNRLYINGKKVRYKQARGNMAVLPQGGESEGGFFLEIEGDLQRKVVLPKEFKKLKFSSLVVPPGHYFVLSDLRSQADDSRAWGTVPEQDFIGKAQIVWLSVDWQQVWEGEKMWPQIRWSRFFKPLH